MIDTAVLALRLRLASVPTEKEVRKILESERFYQNRTLVQALIQLRDAGELSNLLRPDTTEFPLMWRLMFNVTPKLLATLTGMDSLSSSNFGMVRGKVAALQANRSIAWWFVENQEQKLLRIANDVAPEDYKPKAYTVLLEAKTAPNYSHLLGNASGLAVGRKRQAYLEIFQTGEIKISRLAYVRNIIDKHDFMDVDNAVRTVFSLLNKQRT